MQSLSSFQIIRTPKKTKAAAEVCKCGWIHKLGKLPSCKFALAALESQDMSVRKETTAPALASSSYASSSYGYRKQHPNYRWSVLKSQAKRRGLACSISFELFHKTICEPCWYGGGHSKKFRGTDRKDNALGYEAGNITACCSTCNYMKGMLDIKAFAAHVHRIEVHSGRS